MLVDLSIQISDEDEVRNEGAAELNIVVWKVFPYHIELFGKIEDY